MQITNMIRCLKTHLSIKSLLIIIQIQLVFTIVLVAPARSLAATYYVDQNHPPVSDTNPGTEALPWKTLYKLTDPLIVAGYTGLVKANRVTINKR